MKHLVLILIVAAQSGLSGVAQGQTLTIAPLTNADVTNLVSAIRQKADTEGEEAAKVAAMKRAAYIRKPDRRIIEALLDNVGYRPVSGMGESVFTHEKFTMWPAFDGLETIGEPIVPYLLERLKPGLDPELRQVYVHLLRTVLGKERAAALLKKNIQELAEQKARLEKSLELLQKEPDK